MKYDYLRDQYDVFNEDLLQSSFGVVATINIQYDEVSSESTADFADNDITAEEPIKLNYPLDLNSSYRITVYPIDKSSLSKSGVEITYGIQGRFEPYDRWISCFKRDVFTRNNLTLFDHADSISIQGVRYTVKGTVPDTFGREEVLHVFLTKEYDE
jgi:hypothetical protein